MREETHYQSLLFEPAPEKQPGLEENINNLFKICEEICYDWMDDYVSNEGVHRIVNIKERLANLENSDSSLELKVHIFNEIIIDLFHTLLCHLDNSWVQKLKRFINKLPNSPENPLKFIDVKTIEEYWLPRKELDSIPLREIKVGCN